MVFGINIKRHGSQKSAAQLLLHHGSPQSSLYITVWFTQFARSTWRGVYGCYAWFILVLVVIPVTILLLVLPGIMRRRRLARLAARLVCLLTGSRVRVSGWTVPEALPCIVVANHGSYLDGIVLTAILPARFAFLVKSEMASVPLAGFVLRLLGSEFVERDNPHDRQRAAKRLIETAKRGWTLTVFPEGTIDIKPGLRQFHAGAFIAALRGPLPVVPVVISGTREKLAGESRLPRPGPIEVHICEALPSERFESVEALIAATRRAMLNVLDEPDLAGC
jgi:1-acyl-sn-glycerol-3-phosphate acyltransferase